VHSVHRVAGFSSLRNTSASPCKCGAFHPNSRRHSMSITRRTFACLAAATLTQSPALAQEWPRQAAHPHHRPLPGGRQWRLRRARLCRDCLCKSEAGRDHRNQARGLVDQRLGSGGQGFARWLHRGGIQCRSEASLDEREAGQLGRSLPATSAELRARLAATRRLWRCDPRND
jgi:hypothetical protein